MQLVVAGLKIELHVVDALCLATLQQEIRRPFSKLHPKHNLSNITGFMLTSFCVQASSSGTCRLGWAWPTGMCS